MLTLLLMLASYDRIRWDSSYAGEDETHFEYFE